MSADIFVRINNRWHPASALAPPDMAAFFNAGKDARAHYLPL